MLEQPPSAGSNDVSKNPGKHFATVILVCVPLVIPCFWQKRIQATDLSSHIYNAWLSVLTAQGKLQGLYLAPQHNNVLFDFALQWLLPRVGVAATQRIAVSIAVLIFASGALALITTLGGRNWSFSLPCVAILSYGFIFHMGFFNYYISMGICMWYLALVWMPSWGHRLAATPLLLVGWIAHPLPVVWALGMAVYIVLARQIFRRHTLWIFSLGSLTIIGTRLFLIHSYACLWSSSQLYWVTGANDVMVFGSGYALVMAALLIVWLWRVRRLIKQNNALAGTIPIQLWVLNALAVCLIPNNIFFPQYGSPLGMITQRLSLGAAILLCAVLAALPTNAAERVGLVLIAAVFFGMIFADTWKLNRIEDDIDAAVAQLPAGERVLGSFPTRLKRVSPLLHALDRACIGRCFSYANYEPSSRQFRLRVRSDNPYVMKNYGDAFDVQMGRYVVQPRDLPAYLVYLCGEEKDRVCSHPLQAGDVAGPVSSPSSAALPSQITVR
jgi:hypothetical protein